MPDLEELKSELEQKRQELAAKRRATDSELKSIRKDIRKLEQDIVALDKRVSEIPPKEAIGLLSHSFPFLLFPVRIETKFMPDEEPGPQLWVRIYPDEIAVESHEELLTPEEFEAGAQYYSTAWPALIDPPPEDEEDIRRNAWRKLVSAFGSERSVWILQRLDKENFVLNLSVKGVYNIEKLKYRITERAQLFAVGFDSAFESDLNNKIVPESWYSKFKEQGYPLSESVHVVPAAQQWHIRDPETRQTYNVVREDDRLVVLVIAIPRFKVTDERLLFTDDFNAQNESDLKSSAVPESWSEKFRAGGFTLSENRSVNVIKAGAEWEIIDKDVSQTYRVIKDDDELGVYVMPVPVRPDSWSQAPRSHVMPDRFVVRLYRGDGPPVYEQEGAPIPHPLILGPTPFGADESDNEGDTSSADATRDPTKVFFGEDASWITDFDEAVSVGMGLRIDLTKPEDLSAGFDRVTVLGIKATAEPGQGTDYIQNLIQSHQYTEGFAFLRQGTPTNNTSEARAGYSRGGAGADESFERVHGAPLFCQEDSVCDGPRVASAMGIPVSSFQRIEGADGTEDLNARNMLQALWSATLGYYFDVMMNNVLSTETIEALKQHAVSFVRGRGPFPAFRIGNMPYGILPTIGLNGIKTKSNNTDLVPPPKDFDGYLSWFLLKLLYPRWRVMADDVPRAGGSDDPEKELIEILGMEATGRNVHLRSIITEQYQWHLLRFMQTKLFNSGFPWSVLPQTGQNYFKGWWEDFERTMDQSRVIFRQLVPDVTTQPGILNTVPWNPARSFKEPLVTGDPLSEKHGLEGAEPDSDPNKNYINWFRNELQVIRDDELAAAQSNSLLFQLLRRSILWKERQTDGGVSPSQPWIDYFDPPDKPGVPTAELERLLVESLDIASHRLDAWITSIATKRLDSMRTDQPEGVYLGAYGWAEGLRPNDSLKPDGGYIHAPSISHATTAAILRNAYLTHADKENTEVMAVKLTSERVRRARWLLEGIREGQELGALLGYRFERLLHDLSGEPNGLELDQYKWIFRDLFPLRVIDRDEAEAEVEKPAAEEVAARNVVDGRRLVEERENIPFDTHTDLPSTGPEYEAIQAAIDSLEDMLDALGDLALSESVYHSVQGNYTRAGALLDTLAGNGRPPEPEVVETPRSGINLKHRVLVLFTSDPISSSPWPPTPRAIAEPHLNAWEAQLLGNPERIKCTARFPKPGAVAGLATEQYTLMSLADLKIAPLDFLYLSQSPLQGEATELEERIYHHFRRPWVQIVVQLRGKPGNGSGSLPALDNVSSYPGGALETFSWSHTVDSEDDGILIVGFSHNKNGASVESVFFSDQELTRFEHYVDSVGVELWYQMAPAVGTFDITVILDKGEQVVAGAVSFTNVSQEEPFDLVTRASGLSNTFSTTATGPVGTILLDIWSKMGAIGHPVASEDQMTLWFEKTVTALTEENNVQGGMSYASAIEEGNTVSWEVPMYLQFKRTDVLNYDDIAFNEVMPVARKMLELIGNARALNALDLQLPEEAVNSDEVEESPEILEQLAAEHASLYNILKQRLDSDNPAQPGAFNLLEKVKDILENTDPAPEALEKALVDSSYFGVQGAVRSDLSAQEYGAQIQSVSRQVTERYDNCQNALDAAEVVFDETDPTAIDKAVQHLISGFKALFGEGFKVLPPCIPNNRDELNQALNLGNTSALLDGWDARSPVLWLQQVARVHPDIQRFESAMMLAEALSGKDRLQLRVGQLPHQSPDRWLALPLKNDNGSEIRQGALSLVVHSPGPFDGSSLYAGLVLGDWDEIIPRPNETTAVAFNFNQPDAEPPQTLLLAVPPAGARDADKWSWEMLVDSVESTLELAKVRGVDLDALKNFGRFLPAIYSPVSLRETDSG